MSGFDFSFTLFGLLLGLALAEGLGGLARALKARHKVRIGWPTALLGLFVSCDVVTFWMYGWTMRDLIKLSWPTLFGGFLVTAIYYVSASLIFPDDPEDWSDMNGHFDRHRQKILAGILACNILLMATVIALTGLPHGISFRNMIITWSFFPVSVLGIATSNRRVVLICLIWLIFLYPLSVIWTE